MYLDRVKINIKAGNGGNGHTSFFRSKLTMNGGPDGGDGGKGGDVVFVANQGINSLLGFSYKKKFFATDGLGGQKQFRKGSDGKDVIVEVPCGTVIIDAETEKPIADLIEHGQRFVALSGGAGGRGNTFFKSSTRQAPHFSQTGEQTKERQVILELKSIADVGLVGYPNVGKSTLLSVITNATPKIANYHFTTIYPNIGVVPYHEGSFVVADIPGLIDGASEGVGLGHEFLKHIERTKVIIHMVDAASVEGRDPVEDIKTINKELEAYNADMLKRPQLIAANKIDAIYDEEDSNIARIKEEFDPQGINVFPISSVSGKGLK